ncbi:hypothetical protein QFZ96_004498 [Paraburkholderia youngii]
MGVFGSFYQDCGNRLWFRAECRDGSQVVDQICVTNTPAVLHVIVAATYLPFHKYDVIVDTCLSGSYNGDIQFIYSNSPPSDRWKTAPLCRLTNKEKSDKAKLQCQVSAPRIMVEISSTAQYWESRKSPASAKTSKSYVTKIVLL